MNSQKKPHEWPQKATYLGVFSKFCREKIQWDMEIALYIIWPTYCQQYGESLTCHSWFEPISTRLGLGKPASCLTSFGESNSECSLPEYRLLLWGPWHALPHFCSTAKTNALTTMWLKTLIVEATKMHESKLREGIGNGCCITKA